MTVLITAVVVTVELSFIVNSVAAGHITSVLALNDVH